MHPSTDASALAPSVQTRVLSLTVPADVFRRFTDVANTRYDYSQRAKSSLFCELWADYCLRNGLPAPEASLVD